MLIRPAVLKDKPGNGKYRMLHTDGTFARPIVKEDVAIFLFDALENDQWDSEGVFPAC